MYNIKDGVDLKELKKFGFVKHWDIYGRWIVVDGNYIVLEAYYYPFVKRNVIYGTGIASKTNVKDKVINSLIQAEIIEKSNDTETN